MKLKSKIRYVILTSMILLSLISTVAYQGIYNSKILESKVESLNNDISSMALRVKYDVDIYRSLIDQIIESRKANIFILDARLGAKENAMETGELESHYPSGKIRNDAIKSIRIYDSQSKVIFQEYRDNVYNPENKGTLSIINNNSKTESNEHFYQVVKDSDDSIDGLVIVRKYYSKNIGEPVFIEIDTSANPLKNLIDSILLNNDSFLTYAIEYKESSSNYFEIEVEPFIEKDDLFLGRIMSEIVDIKFSFDSDYVFHRIKGQALLLIVFNLLIGVVGYLALTTLIGRLVISPIQKLINSIESHNPDSGKPLKVMSDNDEVSLLNDRYIQLFDKLHHLSNCDPLTGLSNRLSFNKKLNSLIRNRKQQTLVAVFYIDLNNFKSVNDDFGHDKGDMILKSYADKLVRFINLQINKNEFKAKVTDAARLGGDEFVVAIGNISELQHIKLLASKISCITEFGLEIGSDKFDIFSSVGVSYTVDNHINGKDLIKMADSAMYFAKSSGRNEYRLFDEHLKSQIDDEKQIEAKIRETLVNDDFFLTFMPCIESKSKMLVGFEALLRAPSLLKDNIGPDLFIPIAEKTDLIIKIDRWVATHAVATLKSLVSKYGFKGVMAINMSSKSLRNDEFYLHMKKLVASNNVNPCQIEIELTETCMLPNDKRAVSSLNKLKSLGLKIALDDFGTGYTSFSQIVNYPLDTLKIDRSFVSQLDYEIEGKPAIDIIYELAKVYGLSVIVEGIESVKHFEHIKELGCDMAQGYFFSKPKTISEIELDYFDQNIRTA